MAQAPVKIRRIDFYPADWLEGTIGLRDDERGVYIQACMLIYARGGPITDELLKASCSSHGNAFNRILGRLETLGKLLRNDSEIDQKRCGKELEKAQKRLENDAELIRKKSETNGLEPRTYVRARQPSSSPSPSLSLSLRKESSNRARARGQPPDAPPARERERDFDKSGKAYHDAIIEAGRDIVRRRANGRDD